MPTPRLARAPLRPQPSKLTVTSGHPVTVHATHSQIARRSAGTRCCCTPRLSIGHPFHSVIRLGTGHGSLGRIGFDDHIRIRVFFGQWWSRSVYDDCASHSGSEAQPNGKPSSVRVRSTSRRPVHFMIVVGVTPASSAACPAEMHFRLHCYRTPSFSNRTLATSRPDASHRQRSQAGEEGGMVVARLAREFDMIQSRQQLAE